MPPYKKSREVLEVELRERLEALRAAAKGYDDGNLWCAKDLSNHIYILLHDGTGRTKSLLGLLGLKAKLRLLSSKVIPPSASGGEVILAQATPLLLTRVTSDGAIYVPMFGDCPLADQYRWVQFSRWWDECVFHPLSALKLSRKNLICTARNQDGGGHVDAEIREKDYAAFLTDGDPSFRQIEGGVALGKGLQGKPVDNGLRATIRQIAWEVDQSLSAIGH